MTAPLRSSVKTARASLTRSSCSHCDGPIYAGTPHIEATFCRSRWINQVGALMAEPVGKSMLVHLSCVAAVDGGAKLGASPIPNQCDVCRDDIRGDLMWRLEPIGKHMGWRYSFAYLCTCCASSYVFAE